MLLFNMDGRRSMKSPSRTPTRTPTRSPTRSPTRKLSSKKSTRQKIVENVAPLVEPFKTKDFLLRISQFLAGTITLAIVANFQDSTDILDGWPPKIEFCIFTGVANLVLCLAFLVWTGLSAVIKQLRQPEHWLYKAKQHTELGIDFLFVIFWLTTASILSQLLAQVSSHQCPSILTTADVPLTVRDAWCDIGTDSAGAAMAIAWLTMLLWIPSFYRRKQEIIGDIDWNKLFRRNKGAAAGADEDDDDVLPEMSASPEEIAVVGKTRSRRKKRPVDIDDVEKGEIESHKAEEADSGEIVAAVDEADAESAVESAINSSSSPVQGSDDNV